MSPTGHESADRIVVDTDVFSYILDGRGAEEPYLPEIEGKIALLSFQTIAEVLTGAFQKGWGKHRLDRLREEFRKYGVVQFSYGMTEIYARLRTNDRQLKPGDAWIASSAMWIGCPLLTNNWSDFEASQDLGLVVISHAPKAPKLRGQS